ncbi:MAG: cytochrome b [Candidatus Nitrotoga sp. MKT]|nr:MAG: cytochrome b [Candidatus Nitrotoga sp. MKT]
MSQRILVWDVPTRVFHWLLVLSFSGAFLTAETERYRDIHVVLGYTLLGLIAFRLLWGFFGTRYAKFRSFLFKPHEIVAYSISLLKGKPSHYVGHNPAGSVAIWLLLILGILSGVTGVILFQDIGGDVMEELHEDTSNAMLAIVFVHIAGVVVSSLMHRENLVRSMVNGFKSAEPNEGIRRSYLWLGVIMLASVMAFWAGYPATGLVTTNEKVAQAGQHSND